MCTVGSASSWKGPYPRETPEESPLTVHQFTSRSPSPSPRRSTPSDGGTGHQAATLPPASHRRKDPHVRSRTTRSQSREAKVHRPLAAPSSNRSPDTELPGREIQPSSS